MTSVRQLWKIKILRWTLVGSSENEKFLNELWQVSSEKIKKSVVSAHGVCDASQCWVWNIYVSHYNAESGISTGTVKYDFCGSYHSVVSGISICTVNRIYICRITMVWLEFLFVRSNRVSVCRITVLSLESLFVRSNRIYVFCITVLSLEFLFVRSNRISTSLVLQCWVWNLFLYGQIGFTVLSLESLFVRSNRIYMCLSVESGISICTVK